MSGFENWPAPILRRWLLSTAAGPVIFLIGLAGRIIVSAKKSRRLQGGM